MEDIRWRRVTARTSVLLGRGQKSMIEGGGFPCGGGMTLGTIVRSAIVHGIGRSFMASCTISFRRSGQDGVIEALSTFPAPGIVACHAVVRQSFMKLVAGVLMASDAIRHDAH